MNSGNEVTRNYRARGRSNFRGNWRGAGGGRRYSKFQGHRTTNSNNKVGPDHDNDRKMGSQSRITDHMIHVPCPYKGWMYYFANEVYSDNHPLLRTIRIFENYFIGASNSYRFSRENLTSESSFIVDLRELFADEEIRRAIPDIESEVINFPTKIISCLGLAMYQLISLELEEENQTNRVPEREVRSDLSSSDDDEVCAKKNEEILPIIRARLINMEPVVPLKNLKASYYEKFVAISGTVIRVGSIRPYCIKMAFKCGTCGVVQSYTLPDGKYHVPTKCISRECRGHSFTPDRASPLTKLVDIQSIRVQENSDTTGRVPRTIECELMQDLADSCVPGDVVTITGIVKIMSSSEGVINMKQDKCLFLIFIQAHSVCNKKRQAAKPVSRRVSGLATSFDTTAETAPLLADTSLQLTGVQYTATELDLVVQEVRSQPQLFRLLVASLCPAIFGHEIVKAGLLLGLFGGTQHNVHDPNRIPVRGDPHVLVVGDPGLGKSQMLQACANVTPRGVYVCGNTTTTSGLTVTLTKEGSGSGDCGLEAGALVLSDQGCCCIDEFDKMGSQHQALLEAMEQQSISIAKAGVVCSLPARASVLAAANPVGGHYNKSKTVSENLKMGSALLSRFDLVFILIDKPDEEVDSKLSKHVLALHAGAAPQNMARNVWNRQFLISSQASSSIANVSDEPGAELKPLRERLKPGRVELADPIPHPILKAYIGYARSQIHPRLSLQAAKLLQNFYIELRKQHQGAESTPVTTRQLESLIRLSEARARSELRKLVTEEDARDVIELMRYSMIDTFSDQFGVLDFQRSQHGSGMSSRSAAKKFIAILTRQSELTSNSVFTMQQLKEIAKENNLSLASFGEFVDSLNNQGYLLKKGPSIFKLNTV